MHDYGAPEGERDIKVSQYPSTEPVPAKTSWLYLPASKGNYKRILKSIGLEIKPCSQRLNN